MQRKPRLAIIGLVHGHVNWITANLAKYSEFELVGIAESDQKLIDVYAKKDNISTELFFTDATEMLESVKPDAVAVFTNTFDHLEAVRLCAPRGIHVMVEKPLAISVEHATEMASLAKQHKIHLITNFETSWYATTHQAYKVFQEGQLGHLHKLVVHDGHDGPKERGCSPEFLNWLFDPKLNGAGALMDFGCYGVNLMTWFMDNQKPISVTAVTQQLKTDPDYAKVDDEATIILTYPKAQAIIQGSWNWPIDRKDMELYGSKGQLKTINATSLTSHLVKQKETTETLEPFHSPEADPFRCLSAVVKDGFEPTGLWSLENNLIVVEVLEAAKKSALSGQRILL